MDYVYLAIGLVVTGMGLFALISRLRAYRHDDKANSLSKTRLRWVVGGLLCMAVAGFFLQQSIDDLAGFSSGSNPMSSGRSAMALFGASLFFLFFSTLWSCFYLRFYRPDTEEKQMKLIKLGLYGSIPLTVFALLFLGEGVAPFLSYPLTCGFTINSTGFHWINAKNLQTDKTLREGFSIRWYGVIIVLGALVCYLVSDHKFYQKYGKHGILETLLLVAFPSGIVAARIWYVVGNWEREGFNHNFAQAFHIWDGGLTILGGAFGGILAGVLFMLLARKWVDIRFAMDTIVPTILLGQAIGRWGNFFNSEVYGQTVALNSGWNWLPGVISGQMGWDCAEGMIHVPLFLIESMLNIAGYFLIAYLIPFLWKKNRGLGVLSGFYLLWYGVVRIIMEPLRDSNFNMGVGGNWSVWNSMVYIILGVLLVAAFQIIWVVQKGKTWSRGSLEKATESVEVKAKDRGRKKEEGNSDSKIQSSPTMVIPEEKKEEEERH